MKVAVEWISTRALAIAATSMLFALLLLPACYGMTDEIDMPDGGEEEASNAEGISTDDGEDESAGGSGEAGRSGSDGQNGGSGGAGGAGAKDAGVGPIDAGRQSDGGRRRRSQFGGF